MSDLPFSLLRCLVRFPARPARASHEQPARRFPGHRLASAAAGFGRDDRGSVALITGLTALVLVVMAGAGVDYARARKDESRLDAALDAAVLAGAQAVKLADSQGQSDTAIRQTGQSTAEQVFRTFSPDTTAATTPQSQFGVAITGRNVTVTGAYTASTRTTLSGLTGTKTLGLSGNAKASVDLSPLIDVYLLIDVSGSMALGATATDIAALQANLGCAFACHDGAPVKNTTMDSYQWAKANGINLRLDEMNQGILDFVNWLRRQEAVSKRMRISIYAFSTTLTKVLDLTSDLSQVAGNLPKAPSASGESDGATLFGTIMPQFTKAVGTSGDGITTPKKLVILATDGVADPGRSWTWDVPKRASVAPFDPAQCAALKTRGGSANLPVWVGVIYTPYLAMPWDWGYNATLGQPSQVGGRGTRLDDIPSQLTACATSSDFYMEASKTGSVGDAMAKLFNTFAQIRLAN
ncbi:pilus assembly protein TadG-related protein [Methylobacterium nonmethylotrophicum]|nr:pilus assembly protein TadG-related protein [Methylobacterium nonmethylotrophicum]